MFRVNDPVAERQKKIRGFLRRDDQMIAVLLAAADCERTVRRAILALGTTPTVELAHRLGRPRPKSYVAPTPAPPRYGSTIAGYHKAWSAEVLPKHERKLLDDVAGPKDRITKAFQLRHSLIHGETGTTGEDYAKRQVEVLLEVTQRVHDYAMERHVDLTKTLKGRPRPRGTA